MNQIQSTGILKLDFHSKAREKSNLERSRKRCAFCSRNRHLA